MLLMKNKKEIVNGLDIEIQLENLKKENIKLKDSLLLQSTALEREKREK